MGADRQGVGGTAGVAPSITRHPGAACKAAPEPTIKLNVTQSWVLRAQAFGLSPE
jgi:hypothetical protein